MEDQFPDLTQSEVVSAEPQATDLPDLSNSEPMGTSIGREAVEKLAQWRQDPDKSPLLPHQASYLEAFGKLYDNEMALQNGQGFYERGVDNAKALDLKKAASGFVDEFGKVIEHEKERAGQISDLRDPASLAKASLLLPWQSLRDTGVSGAKALAGLFPMTADLVSSGLQSQIGLAKSAHVISPESEQRADAALNASTDLLHGAVSSAGHKLDEVTGNDPQSLASVTAENITPLAVPIGGAEELSNALTKTTSNLPKYAAKAEQKIFETAAAATPLAAKAAKAGIGLAAGAALGHGIAQGATNVLELLGAGLGFIKSPGAMTQALKANLTDLAQAAAIKAEADGPEVIDALWKHADQAAQTAKESADYMRKKLSPDEIKDLDWRAPSTGEPLAPEQLSPAARKVREAEAQIPDLQNKAETLRNTADNKRFFDRLAGISLDAGAHTLEGAAIGGAISGAGSVTGDKDALGQGVLLGGALGAAGGASKVPGEVRAAVREVNRSDLARRGESALPENHPLYEAHSQALASQPSYVKDYVNINSGLAASKGARVVVLKGADFVKALGDAGVEVDPSRPPAGEFDKSTNTAYVNVDHLGSGVVPHEITHAIDQATGLSKSGKFSQAFDAMMNSRDPADQEAIANARDKYEERLNKNLPPGSKKMTLTMDGLKEELAADLGSDLIHDVTPEGLYGGKSVTQRVEQHLRNLRNKITGDKTGKTDTFGFPVTHEMREALLDELFNAGKEAKARKSESIPYEGAPPEAEAPAKPANPQTVQDAILALKKLGIPSPKAKVGEAINALGADAKVEDVVRNAINMMPGEDTPAINFMPSDHPDALDKPALRRKSDGKVFAAKNRATPHWMIPDQHPEAKDRYQSGGYDRWEDGYVKNDGGFVDKKEGHKLALKTGQIDAGTKTEYRGSLSSLDLGEHRNFMPSFEDGLTEVPKPPAQTKHGEGNYYKTAADKLSGHAGEIMKERAALMNQDGFEVAQPDGSTKYYRLDRDKYLKNFMPSMEQDAEHHLVGQVREINNRLQGLVNKPNDPKYRELSDKKAALWKDIHKLRAGSVRDFGIIGSGPAGLGAAASAAYEGVDTVLLEKEIGVGGQPKNSSRIENLYGTQTEGITGPEMTRNALGKAKANGAEVRAGVGVKKLEYDPKTGVKTLTYSNGQKEQFKNVQISVGNEFRKLDVPGAEYAVNGNGRMAALEAKGGTLIVVGGGNSASQAALGAIEAGGVKKVLLFARSGLHGMSESQGQQIEAHPKIQVVNDEIARIDKDGKTLNVKTKGGDEYPVNAVGTFVGGKPKVDWLPKEIQLDNEGKIVTNSKGETSMPGVYAAGDARSGSTPRIAIASGHGSGVASEVSKKIWNEKNTQKSQTGLGGISLETTRNESISNNSGSTTPSEPQPVTTPTSSGNAEGATVNIGLDVKDGPRLKTSDVVSALRAKGVNIDGYVVHQSDSEPTFVAKLDRPLTPEEAHSVSAELKQEAIAQHDGTKGELYGPGAENWKPFNPDYFLTENGKRLSEGSTNRPNNDLGAPPERSDSPAGSTQPEGQLNESNGLNQPKFMPAPPPASPEFQKWFKGSKVVDESGKPKIVLHGTAYDFNKFDKNKLGSSTNQVDTNLGFFFTEDPEGANYFSYFAGLKKKGVPGGDAYEIASEPDPKSVEGTGANIIPAVLSIQKPYVFKDYGAFDAQVFGALHSVFGISPDKESQNRQFVQSLKDQGYDGIRIKGGAHYMMGGEDAKGKDAWIAFEAQQVKSAIGNRGTWSSKSPNMNFMPAPHIEREASRLGLQYKGDDGDTHLFHDPITRTTIPLAQDSERGKLQEKLKAKRDQFQNGLRDVNFLPSVPDDKDVTSALSEDKKGYVGAHRDLPEGTPVGVRIDIPAYERSGNYVQTIHEMARGNTVGKRIGYDGIVTLDNPTFMSNEKGAEKIRAGSAKFPVATVEGEYNPSREMPKDLADWEPVGYNPKSHSYFYSKESGEPVVAGDKAISTGNTVYVKNPQFGNKGDFRFMPSSHEGFYSPLEKHLEDKMPNRVSPEQLSGMIAKGGIKKAEMEWSGINDLIDQAKKEGRSITKQEALDYVRANTPEIKEVTLGKGEKLTPDEHEEYQRLVNNEYNDPDVFDEYDRLAELEDRSADADSAPTKYSQYQLPGGENYRELLMTLPEKSQDTAGWTATRLNKPDAGFNHWEIKNANGDRVTNIVGGTEESAIRKAAEGQETPFKSSHFDEPNIVGHLRVNDRTLPDGKKMLFAEEVQSDWAQKGRKEGYRGAALSPLELKEYNDLISKRSANRTPEEEARIQELDSKQAKANTSGVPDTPFKGEAWKKLMLRNLIRHAVEQGYDSVGWTTGDQQAERYDLSKHLDQIDVTGSPDTGFTLDLMKDGGTIKSIHGVRSDEIVNYVGKDLGEKILKDTAGAQSADAEYSYSGLDLRVGGEGMKGFYDKELVNLANDIGKKFGAKVEPATLNIGSERYRVENHADGHYVVDRNKFSEDDPFDPELSDAYEYMSYQKRAADKEAARLNSQNPSDTTVHSMEITPSMRDSVQTQGQPMFMPSLSDLSPIEAAREKFLHGEKVVHDSDEHFWTKAWPEFLKATGATLSPKKESSINLAAERAVGDVRKFLDDNPKFKDYYNKDWDETRKALGDHYGRKITDDEMTFFKLATGLTSPNTSLQSNTGDAMGVFDQWLKDGHLDSIKMGVSPKGNRVLSESPVSISGATNGIKAFTLKIVDKLSKDFGGPVKAANYLMEPVSPKELNDFKQSLGYKGKVGKLNSIKELVEQATGQSEKIPRMFIFGRKVGAYTLNLLGDHKYNTVDIWESRFIRSQFKGMFGEGRTGLPVNADEHTLFSRFSDLFNEEFRKQTGMNMEASALQAARWFYMLSAVKAAGYTGTTTSDTISHYVKEHIKKVQKKSDLSDVNIPEPDPLQ